MDRKIRLENIGKSLSYDIPMSSARKILVDLVFADHTYAKASSLDPEFNRIHSTNLLFAEPEDASEDNTDVIDIEGVVECKETKLDYDEEAGRKQMSELEQCFEALHEVDGWQEDDQITRTGWTREQARLFDQVYKILSTYRVARCSYKGHLKEQILRSLAADKAAKRFRNIAGAVAWDSKLMPWLHTTLVNGVNSYIFLCYLEILQNLKSKVSNLVEKMTVNSTLKPERSLILDSPKITGCLNTVWNPTPKLKSARTKENAVGNQKEQMLENKPLLMMIPRGPCVSFACPKRSRFWQSQLGSIGRFMQINMLDVEKSEDFAVSSFLESVIGGARSKISLFKSQFPGKPVILIGWSIGALLSCQIATLENVSGVVCLGYPSYGLDGVREAESYNCLDIRCPVMFVIGTHSPVCSAECIENLREKMRVDTRLLLVEGGNEILKLTSSHKRRMQITQNMVDRLIMDEVEKFIADILMKGDKAKESCRPDTPSSSNQAMRGGEKKRKLKRPDAEKSVIEKKKVRVSPSQQQKIQNKGKTKGSSPQSTGLNRAGGAQLPKSNSMPASQGLSSSTSPLVSPRTLSLSSRDQTIRNVGSNPQASKLTVRSPHLKYIEKPIKKPKFLKEPQTISKTLLSPAQKAISKADMLAMQRFPKTSSILLSNSGAHLRLHDGKIVQVSSADGLKSHQTSGLASTASLKPQSGLCSKTVLSMTSSASKDSSLSVTSILPNSSTVKPFPALTNLAGTYPVRSAVAGISQNAVVGEAANSLAGHSSASVPSYSSPEIPVSTQLSPSDLKYLTDLFNRGQVAVESASRVTDIQSISRQSEPTHLVPESPISAKIGIGTLTNLVKPDGSPPGSGTRQSPGSGLKQSPPNDPKDTKKSSQHISSDITATVTQTSTFVRKEINKGLRSTPVTITIPTYNTNSQGMAALKVSSVLGGSTGPPNSATLGHSQPIAKIGQSKSTNDLSQLMNKTRGKPTLSAASTGRLSIVSSSTSPATLTVSSRQIQGTTRSMGNPQTITLHIPSSAMLKDNKNLKPAGPEIKFIGFLNQKGRSPMSSPIHFSVQSQSNPASPKSQSPSILFTSKSDPPSPNPVKVTKGRDKEMDSQSVTSLKTPNVPLSTAPVSLAIPKELASSLACTTGNLGSKIAKPTTIQTALIKSLASVPFSPKQKESLSNLLKNQNLKQGQEINSSKIGKTLQTAPSTSTAVNSSPVTTHAVIANATKCLAINHDSKLQSGTISSNSDTSSRVATPVVAVGHPEDTQAKDGDENVATSDENSRGSISFVSDSSVATIVKNSCDTQGEVNGHGLVSGKTRDKEADCRNSEEKRDDSSHASSPRIGNELSISEPTDLGVRHQYKTNCDLAKTDFDVTGKSTGHLVLQCHDDSNSEIVESSQLKRQKRFRESSSLDTETACDEDLGPTPNKRLTRRALSSGDGQESISNVQKTEE